MGAGKFCSQACYQTTRSIRIKRYCVVCSKEFTTSQGYIDKGWAKWCSKKCQHSKPENNSNWHGGKAKKKCLNCGKTIFVWSHQVGRFCSRKCSSSFNGAGEKNPNWRGGLSFEPYTANWNESLKHTIRVRDNFTCQICFGQQNGKLLNIHHINYSKQDNNPQNLITLCCKCHSKTNFKREGWEKKLTILMEKRSIL